MKTSPHIPATNPASFHVMTDDELITCALDANDYMTRRLALVAHHLQTELHKARRELGEYEPGEVGYD